MPNVFLSFSGGIENNSHFPLFYEAFINGLQKHGNNVLFVADPSKGKLKKTVKKIKEFSPDLIILFNNHFPKYNFFNDFDCPVVVYAVDSILYWQNKVGHAKNCTHTHLS